MTKFGITVPLRKCARIISLFYLQRSFFICSVPFLFAAFLFLFAAFPFFICSVPFLVCSVLFLFAAFLFCLQRFFFCLQRFFYLQCVPCGPPYKYACMPRSKSVRPQTRRTNKTNMHVYLVLKAARFYTTYLCGHMR